MRVMTFDLNTHTSGCFMVDIDGPDILRMKGLTIRSKPFIVSEHFPYLDNKKKIITRPKGSKKLNSYVKKDETHVSEQTSKKRNSQVRQARNKFLLNSQVESMSPLISTLKPNLVIGEKNETFNGKMTIEVLAKVYGQLMALSKSNNIPMLDLSVNEVRAPYKVASLTIDLKCENSSMFFDADDKAKAAIAWYLMKKYKRFNLEFETFDESDAALLFDYWYEYIYMEVLRSGREYTPK